MLERFTHAQLRSSPAGLLDADAVAQQCQHTLVAKLAQALVVGCATLDGRRVELEVTGVEEHASRGSNHQADGIRDAVVDRDGLDLERSEP